MKLLRPTHPSVSTTITRLYGRAPQGERLVQKVLHGNWKTITFIAALRHDRITAPFVLEGPMTGEMFKAYTEQFLAPTLKRGDIVFMDNVSVHKALVPLPPGVNYVVYGDCTTAQLAELYGGKKLGFPARPSTRGCDGWSTAAATSCACRNGIAMRSAANSPSAKAAWCCCRSMSIPTNGCRRNGKRRTRGPRSCSSVEISGARAAMSSTSWRGSNNSRTSISTWFRLTPKQGRRTFACIARLRRNRPSSLV